MKYLLVSLALLSLGACARTYDTRVISTNESRVWVVRDETYQVTCWLYVNSGVAISCLPETELKAREK